MSNVEHPNHYTQGNIECIDAMEEAFGTQAVMIFCVCNAFKYIWRHHKKNGVEDIKKAVWYLNKYLSLQKQNEEPEHNIETDTKQKLSRAIRRADYRLD